MGSMTITVENSIQDLLPEVIIDFWGNHCGRRHDSDVHVCSRQAGLRGHSRDTVQERKRDCHTASVRLFSRECEIKSFTRCQRGHHAACRMMTSLIGERFAHYTCPL